MKIIAYPNPSGSAKWRLEHPFKYLRRHGVEAWVSDEGITEKAASWADIIVLQQCVDREGIALLYAYQQEHGKKIIVDLDDFPILNDDNPHAIEHKISDAANVVMRTVEIADMVTVTTEYLAEKIRPYNKNVVILPNYMDLEFWDKPKRFNTSKSIRIGWAGSMTHIKDLEYLRQPLEHLYKEYPQCQFIFVGETRLADVLPNLPIETIPGLPMESWPTKLNALQWDIGLAPLLNNEFNKCKSNIKWQEYAIAQIPGVFSPTVYQERGFDGHFGMIAENQDHWYRALKNMIDFPQLRQDIRESAYTHVTRRFSLEKNIEQWIKAYKSV